MDALISRSDLPSAISQTEVLNPEDEHTQTTQVLRLRLQKPRSERRVGWSEGTLDNEHMNKKKSKCCCIFKKPTKFGESSSEDDEDCEHCFGHPEKRKKNRKDHKHEECEQNLSKSDNVPIQSSEP